MDISQILKSSTTDTNTSTQTAEQKAAQAAAKLSPASQAISKAGNRIQSQLDSTSAQLSAYGKLKSAVSNAQLAAKSLSGLTATSSAADVKTAVGKLVSSFNTAITTGKATAGIADSGNAKRVGNDLARVMWLGSGRSMGRNAQPAVEQCAVVQQRLRGPLVHALAPLQYQRLTGQRQNLARMLFDKHHRHTALLSELLDDA